MPISRRRAATERCGAPTRRLLPASTPPPPMRPAASSETAGRATVCARALLARDDTVRGAEPRGSRSRIRASDRVAQHLGISRRTDGTVHLRIRQTLEHVRDRRLVQALPSHVGDHADDRRPRVSRRPDPTRSWNRLPIGSSPGQNRLAISSLITTTRGAFGARSRASSSLPRNSGMRIASTVVGPMTRSMSGSVVTPKLALLPGYSVRRRAAIVSISARAGIDCRRGRETAQHDQRVGAPAVFLLPVRSEPERPPELDVGGGQLKSGRHHAHHVHSVPIELESSAQRSEDRVAKRCCHRLWLMTTAVASALKSSGANVRPASGAVPRSPKKPGPTRPTLTRTQSPPVVRVPRVNSGRDSCRAIGPRIGGPERMRALPVVSLDGTRASKRLSTAPSLCYRKWILFPVINRPSSDTRNAMTAATSSGLAM